MCLMPPSAAPPPQRLAEIDGGRGLLSLGVARHLNFVAIFFLNKCKLQILKKVQFTSSSSTNVSFSDCGTSRIDFELLVGIGMIKTTNNCRDALVLDS